MATDGGPRGAVIVEEALFDDDAIVPTTRDTRTVGEMLVDVDSLARQLLLDVAGDEAPQLLRGWPKVVAAAGDFWSVLPVRRDPATAAADKHMHRLQTLSDSIETSLGSGWPGTGSSDRRLTQIADTLTHAARLVEHYAGEVPLERPAVRQDLDAACARIMHGLYVTAHAVGVALHQHGRDRYRDARTAGRPIPLATPHSPYAVAPTARWVQRLAACETAASSYLNGRFVQALAGEAPRPPEDPGRLHRALTDWDIQAHRTLARAPTPANILLVARTQGLIAGAALPLVDAARHDLTRSPTTDERLLPAINQAGRAWSNLASRWNDLTTPGARIDGQLIRAATEVRTASRELTHDKTTMASLDEIATRPGLARAATAILHALEAGPDLAHIVSDHADDSNLAGPARALSRRAQNDTEAHQIADDTVWVSPADIVAKRNIPLPPPVTAGLRSASVVVLEAAVRASQASQPATATPLGTDPDRDLIERVATSRPRAPQAPSSSRSPHR